MIFLNMAVATPAEWGQQTWGLFLVGALVVLGFLTIGAIQVLNIVKKPIAAIAREQARLCIHEHDEAVNAHGVYRSMARAEMLARVGEAEMSAMTAIKEHNVSPVAHHIALGGYPTRQELQGAVDRIELQLNAFKDSIIAMITGVTKEIVGVTKEQHEMKDMIRDLHDEMRGNK